MLLFNFEGACPPRKAKEKTERTLRWGCSSAGRAPALQAGGHGFESHHLHQSVKRTEETGKPKKTEAAERLTGLIAQVVRARA